MDYYRIVEDTDNITGNKKFIIEKYYKFFKWEWWSRNYLMNEYGDRCYVYQTEEEAQKMLPFILGHKEKVTTKIISYGRSS